MERVTKVLTIFSQMIFAARTVGAASQRVWFVTVALIAMTDQMRTTVRV